MRAIDKAVDMHVEEGVVSEWVVNATIKHMPGPLKGLVSRTVGFWERMQRVTLQFLRDIGASNLWMENTNEYTAHTPREVLERIKELLPVMARRARMEDWPGVPNGISHGGQFGWGFKYPVHSGPNSWAFSHINIHSPRGREWQRVKEEVKGLMAHGVPVSLNENMYLMSHEQWRYWVTEGHYGTPEQVQKLVNQSTRDTGKIMSQEKECLGEGAAYCLHNMNGARSDPDAREDDAEKKHRAVYGGPSPVPKLRFDHIIGRAYQEVLLRPVDSSGLESYNEAMRNGLEEHDLRALLMKSGEYKGRFTK